LKERLAACLRARRPAIILPRAYCADPDVTGYRGDQMKRREFITLVGGAVAAWPVVARAQQPAKPLIGYLSGRSPAESANIVAAFHQGLKETGFVEGQNVAIEARFAEGNFDLLPALTADLIRRQVNVLVTAGGTVTAVRAKSGVPASIPMIFVIGGDPVKLGIVASLNKPGGNITGVSFLINELAAKEIELLHELMPNASVIGFLVNPKDPNLESDMRGAQTACGCPWEKIGGRRSQHGPRNRRRFLEFGAAECDRSLRGRRSFFCGPACKNHRPNGSI
jgi:hypothetical protein